MSHLIFLSIFKLNFTAKFFKKPYCHVTLGGGGSEPVSPNETGIGGSKIGQKSVTYYLNGPLKRHPIIPKKNLIRPEDIKTVLEHGLQKVGFENVVAENCEEQQIEITSNTLTASRLN